METEPERKLLYTLTDANPSDPSKAVFVYVFTEGDEVHRFESGSSRWAVALDEIPPSPINTFKYWPRYIPAWKTYEPAQGEEGVHVKRARYMHDESKAWWERERTTRDLVINELVRANPHPNVLNYTGCIVQQGHVSGIVYRKLAATLHDVVRAKFKQFGSSTTLARTTSRTAEADLPPLDTVMRDVRAGLAHLLSLGLVYLDISPRNIMWDAGAETWVLIDLSECYAPGTVFYDEIPGTPRFKDVNAHVASKKLHEPMLAKLEGYIKTGVLPERE